MGPIGPTLFPWDSVVVPWGGQCLSLRYGNLNSGKTPSGCKHRNGGWQGQGADPPSDSRLRIQAGWLLPRVAPTLHKLTL